MGPNGLRRGHRRSAGATPARLRPPGLREMIGAVREIPRTVHDLARQDTGQAPAGNGTIQVSALCERLSLIGPIPQKIAVGSRSISRSKSPMPITARTGHRSKNPGDGRASPGIWPVFQTAADDGGITGPVPAQTCGQAAVTLTWMPRKRARRPAGQPEPRRRSVSPRPQAESAEPLAEPATLTRRPTAPSSAAHALPVASARLTQTG